ncbi:hypothetical protein DW886_21430 [Enterocloster aldenensis]|uniref:hypothetical protein n=1 Tax=Enterocloster aldenensis TaxID=358742 RepID=UPI000E489366|nr:hypothetical protein DW886_21430 [Enterocloster aldenensis]
MSSKIFINIKLSEVTFIIGYGLYILYRALFGSAFQEILSGNIKRSLKILVLFILIIAYFAKRKVSVKSFYQTIGLLALGVFTYAFCESTDLICIILLFITSYSVDISKIIKSSIIINTIMIVLVFTFNRIGVLPDYTYSHYSVLEKTIVQAHTYGFLHYSTPAFMILFLSFMVLYFKRSTIVYTILFGINLITYSIFTARLPFFIFIITLLLIFVFNKAHIVKLIGNKLRKFISLLPFVFITISYLLCWFYNSGNYIFTIMNAITSNRLLQGNVGLNEYGIHLFGTPIEMAGTYALKYGALQGQSMSNYFYLDNDYLYSLIYYGVIFTVLILFVYSSLVDYSLKEGNTFIFIWSIMTLVFALINSTLLIVEYNPLIFLGIKVLLKEQKINFIFNNRDKDNE